jgi:aspartate kinase
MIIHKFGGTSIANAQGFARVADIIYQHQCGGGADDPHETVVVVSAMSGVTDQLIAGARAAAEGRDSAYRDARAEMLSRHMDVVESLLTRSPERLGVAGQIEDQLHELGRFYRSIAMLGECTARGLDAVASFGGLLSASILAAVFRERGLRAEAISGTELIASDDTFGAANPLLDQTSQRLHRKVRPLLERDSIPVVSGYVASTEAGVPTTLGRGGGDYSAAIIGAALGAAGVWIWSDADGILTADPNIVRQARTLTELSYSDAANLAYYGSEVLHPKTVRPLWEHSIPLRILNTFNPTHPGTQIIEDPSSEREQLPAIISSTGLSLIAIGTRDDGWTVSRAATALQRLADARVAVLMFSQSSSEHGLSLVVRQQDEAHCLRTLGRHLGSMSLPNIYLESKGHVATISLVGVASWNGNNLVARSFVALGKLGTRVIAVAQAASEHSVSFCIPEDEVIDTVRFLHKELGLERFGQT